jgi:hypothetical protein
MRLQGQVLAQYPDGTTVPYPIGLDGNKNPTNQVLIDYDKATGNVITMYPVPVTGSQGPQSSLPTSGNGITPAGFSGPAGSSGQSDQSGYGAIAGGTGAGSSTQKLK